MIRKSLIDKYNLNENMFNNKKIIVIQNNNDRVLDELVLRLTIDKEEDMDDNFRDVYIFNPFLKPNIQFKRLKQFSDKQIYYVKIKRILPHQFFNIVIQWNPSYELDDNDDFGLDLYDFTDAQDIMFNFEKHIYLEDYKNEYPLMQSYDEDDNLKIYSNRYGNLDNIIANNFYPFTTSQWSCQYGDITVDYLNGNWIVNDNNESGQIFSNQTFFQRKYIMNTHYNLNYQLQTSHEVIFNLLGGNDNNKYKFFFSVTHDGKLNNYWGTDNRIDAYYTNLDTTNFKDVNLSKINFSQNVENFRNGNSNIGDVIDLRVRYIPINKIQFYHNNYNLNQYIVQIDIENVTSNWKETIFIDSQNSDIYQQGNNLFGQSKNNKIYQVGQNIGMVLDLDELKDYNIFYTYQNSYYTNINIPYQSIEYVNHD